MLGYQNQAARVGGIIAPFIVMAGAATAGGGNLIPFATFGAAALLAGLLIFTLPETLGVPLPDTLQARGQRAAVGATVLCSVWLHPCMCVCVHCTCVGMCVSLCVCNCLCTVVGGELSGTGWGRFK